MSFLEINSNESIQVFEEKYLYSKWEFAPTDLDSIVVTYGLKINEDIFIIERHKNSGRYYPQPLLFFETIAFRRVIQAETPWMLTRYSQSYKLQRHQNRQGRLKYEFHTAQKLEKLLLERSGIIRQNRNFVMAHQQNRMIV